MLSSRLLPGIILAFLAAFGIPATVDAATYFFSPASSAKTVGAAFSVSLYINSSGVAINAGQGTVQATTDTLEITGVSTGGSAFNLWTVGPSATASSATFSGGLPSPGYTGSAGKILTLSLRAKAAGTGRLTLSGGSILANDGQGTNVFTGAGSATFTITAAGTTPQPEPEPEKPGIPGAPTISSSTHPDQNVWYANPNPSLTWSRSANVDGFSMELDQTADRTPDSVADSNSTTRTFENISDGTWYFHVRAHTEAGWGPAAHYTLRIDNTAPGMPEIRFLDSLPLIVLKPRVSITANDAGSGIHHFDVFLDDGPASVVSPEEAKNLPLGTLELGEYSLLVRAVDHAGKTAERAVLFSIVQIDAPTVSKIPERISVDNTLMVQGDTVPNVTVVLVFVGNGNTFSFPVMADGKGHWVFEKSRFLPPGDYTMTVHAVSPDGIEGKSSEPQMLTVFAEGVFLQFGAFIIRYTTLIVLLLIIVAVLMGTLITVLIRIEHRLGSLKALFSKKKTKK